MTDKITGKVKWFNDSKGVGFIKRSDAEDVFVHYKSILTEGHKTLKKGQQVEFALCQTDFGWQAKEVVVQAMQLDKELSK